MAITTETINTIFQIRQGNILDWNDKNPILSSGEPAIAFRYDNNNVIVEYIIKIGDGVKSWNELEGFSTAELQSIKKYMAEHGGSWDAIELESTEANKQFMFEANTKTLRHITQDDADSTKIASGLIYNAWQNGSAGFTGSNPDNMIVSGKSTFGVGRNIKVEANYACALGSHHNVTGYGAFAGGTGNIITTLKNNSGTTKNSQYATAFGQIVGTIGAASFSVGTGSSNIQSFVDALTFSNTSQQVYETWKKLERGTRPSISWGDWSARFGSYNISIGNNSFVAGGYNAAVGKYSVAFGENTWAEGDYSFVCGSGNTVLKHGVVGGTNNTATGDYAFIAGYENVANAYSAVFGQSNQAKGSHGFISGWSNTIHSEGASHSGVIGMKNYIGYGGYYSLVAGLNNISHNNGAMVLGAGLISSSNYSLTVGRLNKEVSGGLFVVGNGTGDVKECSINQTTNQIEYNGATPANAFVVYQDGHAEVASDNTSIDNSVPRWKTVKEDLSKKDNATSYNSYVTTNNSKNTEQDNRLTSLETNVKGLSGALQFKGIVEQNPTGLTGYSDGDVVIWNNSEYVWYDNKFNEFGPATDFVTQDEFNQWYNTDYGPTKMTLNSIATTADEKAQEALNRTGYTTIKTTDDGWTEIWVDDEIMSASKTYQGRIDEDCVYGSHWSSDNIFYYKLTDIPAKYHQLNCNIHNIYGYNLEAEAPNIEYPHWATIAHHPGQTNYTIMFRGSEGPGFGPDIYSDPELQIDYLSLSFTITLSK